MFKKLIIPTDGSPLATTAALEGVELAGKLGAEVVGIFVARERGEEFNFFADLRQRRSVDSGEYRQAVTEAGTAYMSPIKEAAEKAGIVFTPVISMSNETAQHIVNEAKANGCDLIYIGSHGYTGWGRSLMGSVATKVFLASSIPVLVHKFTKEEVPKNQIRKSYLGTLPV